MSAPTVSAAPAQLRQSAAFRGRGWTSLEKIASPAAGASLVYPIEATYWRRLLSMAATLTTSAAAGERQIALNYQDGDGYTFNQVPCLAGIGPSSVATIYADQATVTPVAARQSLETEGSVTSPAAGATIASLALPSGSWQVSWTVMLDGTTAVGDDDNFGLYLGSTLLLQSVNGHTAGQPYPQPLTEVLVPTGGATLAIKAVAIGTVGAVYSASFTADPASAFGTQVQIPDFLLKSGWQLQLLVTGIQAADQLSGIGLLMERYPSSHVYLAQHDLADALAEVILAALAG